jgi:flagellar basal-body rod protein FlgG
MIKSLTTAATGMQAQQTNMDVIANNLANVSTTGFKKSRAEFEDLMYQTVKEPGAASGLNAVSPTGVQIGLGVRTSSIQKDFEIGSGKITKNALDVQIEGSGSRRLI